MFFSFIFKIKLFDISDIFLEYTFSMAVFFGSIFLKGFFFIIKIIIIITVTQGIVIFNTNKLSSYISFDFVVLKDGFLYIEYS